jgi:predicted small lipoprotein YifL
MHLSLVALVVLATTFAGCGGEGPATIGSFDAAAPPASTGTFTPPGPCLEGSRRSCKVILGEHEGIQSCFYGIEICAGGRWGPCVEGSLDAGAP